MGQLAGKAWDVFTTIEKAGGALAALDDGVIESLIGDVRARWFDDVAHRRAPITGVTEFAFIDEAPVVRSPLPEAPSGLLPQIRYGQEFEAMRDRSDAAPARPRVYLATPPRCPAAGEGRMNALGSFASRAMRVLSARIEPPVRVEEGSMASTAMR